MIVCRKCKKEMQCITNGVQVRYGTDGVHAYSGDEFECPTCGVTIVNTNGTPWQDLQILDNTKIDEPERRSLTDNKYNIWMNK